MRYFLKIIIFIAHASVSLNAYAILSMELTQGIAGALPIAVVPFAQAPGQAENLSDIVANDLRNSGRFRVIDKKSLQQFPVQAAQVNTKYFRRMGTDYVVVGKINSAASGQLEVNFQLLDMFKAQGEANVVLSKKFNIEPKDLRSFAHHVSDLIYQQITGTRGIFSTKLAYVVVRRESPKNVTYTLEVSDQDGHNPKTLLVSPEPIMSPAWSPDGKQLAYVSFEHQRAQIWLQTLATGERVLLSIFPGINGAPAWSPDAKKLAIVLSKSGSPNIYFIDIATKRLTQITNDFYINTEPAWSRDGKSLVFTSNRSGRPQIYQMNFATNKLSRVSYDGDYNARASFSRDGKRLALLHRVSDFYSIAFLDLDNGTLKVLNSSSADSASPSLAPNDSMVLYDTYVNGRNVLAMVSTDGRVQLTLPAREGDAQDPAWSPYL